ncbi:PAS domain-containing protein [Ideonella sp.]|uniref:PAS domain-containing protein n=1 Tax=Ideonella sp. TaxID=1929293 RepID=UPI0035AEB9A5
MPTDRRQRLRRLGLRLTLIALLCVLFGLIGSTVLLASKTDAVMANSARRADLALRTRLLQTTLIALGDAESGQRGYLLTSKPSYLAPYQAAIGRLPELMAALDGVELPNPTFRSHAERAHALVQQKLAEMAETIRLHDLGQPEQALALIHSDAGQLYMEQARGEIQAALDIINRERERLIAEAAEGLAGNQRLLVVMVTLLVLLTALALGQLMVFRSGRLRAEQALRDSEERHRAIVEEQHELISLASADGTLLYINPAYSRHFGRTPQQLTGTNLYDLVEPADRPAVRQLVDEVLRSGATRHGENRMLTPGGGERWVAWTNRRQVDANGVATLHSVGRDVTERKQLEQRLADSERFMRQIADSLPMRIAYLDRETRFRFANLAHSQRFGRPMDQIIGRTRAELTGGEADDAVRQHVEAVLRGEPQRFEFEEKLGGQVRRIESQLIPDWGPDGTVRGFYSTGSDITARVATERALRDLTEIFDSSTDFVVQADRNGQVSYINPAARRALGLGPDAPASAHHFAEFNTPETNQRYIDEINPTVKAHGVWLGETTVFTAGRRVMPVSHMVIAHRDSNGRIARFSAVMRDITAALQARHELALQSATLQSIIESMPAMVAVVGADGCYRFVNTAQERWLGRPRDQIIGRTVEAVLGADELAQRRPWIERAMTGETVHFERSFPERHQGRHLGISYIPLRSGDTVEGFVVVSQDITPHKEEAVRLTRLAERDALTGLLNRAGFETYLDQRAREGTADSLALLYIDLDHFKPVNDTHGHAVGDQLLRLFAQRIQALVRPSDAVARLGGDEFAVALSGVRERAHADRVADKILRAAHEPFEVGELMLRIGASVGVAFNADYETSWQSLVEHADSKLYQAKAAGRGRRG